MVTGTWPSPALRAEQDAQHRWGSVGAGIIGQLHAMYCEHLGYGWVYPHCRKSEWPPGKSLFERGQSQSRDFENRTSKDPSVQLLLIW